VGLIIIPSFVFILRDPSTLSILTMFFFPIHEKLI
jgi:hypothetical protein